MFLTLVGAFGISLIVVLATMPLLISYLHKINYNQTVSEYSLEEYKQKQKTPTMGGIVFVLTPLAVTLLLQPGAIRDLQAMIVMLAYVGYGLIGFLDDYIIVIRQNNEGLKPRYKFFLQLVLAVLFFFMYRQNASTDVILPFLEWVIPLGGLYMLLVFFMFTGASNAVNLTDGMDGLAAGCQLPGFCAVCDVRSAAGQAGDRDVHHGGDGFAAGLSEIQFPSGEDLHGRYRLAGFGRGAGRRRDDSETGDRRCGDRRGVRLGNAVRHHPDLVGEAARQTRVPLHADSLQLCFRRHARDAGRSDVLDFTAGLHGGRLSDWSVVI